MNLNYEDYITQNEKYLRPEELPYLKGDATETYTNINLQKTGNKVQFSLMDSKNQLLGTIYNNFFNFGLLFNKFYFFNIYPCLSDKQTIFY